MSAYADRFAFVKNDYLVGVLNGAYSLRDYHYRFVALFLQKRPAERRICLEVKSGKAVVENVKLRVLYNGAGN